MYIVVVYIKLLWCYTDIDECATEAHLCDNGNCGNIPGGYTCSCHQGYTGRMCETGKYFQDGARFFIIKNV